MTDVFAVQDELARNIVNALKLSLTPAQQQLIRKRATTENIDAYDYYLNVAEQTLSGAVVVQ